MKRLSDQTLYEIIEVSEEAPPADIRRACDRAAATYGPGSLATYTLASSEESALLCSRIEEARAVLLDPVARARYDERIGVRPATATPEPSAVAAQPAAGPPAPATPPLPPPAPWPAPAAESAPQAPLHVSPGLPVVTPMPHAEPVPASVPVPAAGAAPAPIQLTAAVASPPVPAAISPARPTAPILLQHEVAAPGAPPAEPRLPEGSAWTGGMLRQVREARGLTLQQLAERTRITRHHLENIEQEKFQALPAPVYLRGIIMSLARELRLDGQKVARSYLDRVGAGAEGGPVR